MFGLRFVRHSKFVPIPEEENYDTLIRLLKRDVVWINRKMQIENRFFTENKDEKNGQSYEKIQEEIENTRIIVVQLYRLAKVAHEMIEDYAKRNDETDFTRIGGFYFRHRGMFITLLHQMYDLREKTQKLSKFRKSTNNFLSSLEVIQKKFTFMIGLCELLNHFENEFNTYLGEGVKTIFPYNDTFDMTSIELDNHNFYEEIGKQYYPMARTFFTFYVSMVAGYYDTIKGVTRNEFLRNIVMTGLGVLYSAFPNAKVEKHNKFANDETFKNDGMALWNAGSSPYLAPFFEMGLVPVAVSKTFRVPVTKYLRIVNNEERFSHYVNEGPELTVHQKKTIWRINRNQSQVHQVECKPKNDEKEEEVEGEESSDDETDETENIIIKEEEEEEIKIKTTEPPKLEKIEQLEGKEEEEEINEPKNHQKLEEEEEEEILKLPEFIDPPNCPPMTRDRITGEISMDLFRYFFLRLMTFQLKHPTIELRVIHNFPTKFPLESVLKCTSTHPIIFGIKETLLSGVSSLSSLFTSAPNKRRPFDGSIVFHCHGGGFIAMKSHTHETYLRRWAKQFEVPVISVDYTNAPEEKFPTQPLQCYLAYKFVVQNFERLFGVPLNRVVVAGDSAGGNLCTVIISLAIADGFRVPDGAIINYPTYITAFEACPSRVSAFSDPLVSKPFLELVLGLYPPENYPYKGLDPFLSPIVTPSQVLNKFPPCYITACSLDPLFDDGVTMAKKLDLANEGRVTLTIHDAAPHGFLNFCDILYESRKEIEVEQKWIHWLLDEFYKKVVVEEIEEIVDVPEEDSK